MKKNKRFHRANPARGLKVIQSEITFNRREPKHPTMSVMSDRLSLNRGNIRILVCRDKNGDLVRYTEKFNCSRIKK